MSTKVRVAPVGTRTGRQDELVGRPQDRVDPGLGHPAGVTAEPAPDLAVDPGPLGDLEEPEADFDGIVDVVQPFEFGIVRRIPRQG